MSALSRFLHRRRDESGFAMVVAVIVAMVSIVLVTTILAIGVHLDTQTVRERRWQLALQVAESGVERAIVALDEQAKAGLPLTFGGEGPITVPGGQFETHVTIPADLASVRVDAIGWTPSATATNRIQRRLRVVYSPEPEFRYALFSQTSLYVKSSGGIEGDVFGNEAVTLYNGTVVTGTVISGTGKVHLEQNAEVHENTATGRGGDVYSGGFDTAASPPWAVKLDNNAVVEGDVHTQVETVCSGPANYNVDNSGDLLGQVFTPGSVFGAGPAGGTVSACEPRRGKEDLPSFTFDPANYPSLVTMTVAQFNDPAYTDLAGQVWVTSAASDDSAAAIELACKQVKGDFFLYTTARINK
ncbi:MAG: hypothetical protein ACRD0M_05050, partial [Acidimicrobiales bacterium]